MSRPDGGPAFPTAYTDYNGLGDRVTEFMGGMSLRDYFAAKAMQQMQAAFYSLGGEVTIRDAGPMANIAEAAYKMANAMLAERSKP